MPSLPAKLRISYPKTWAGLVRLFKNPAAIRPEPLPAHLAEAMAPPASIKVPQLKGNVLHTLKEIIAIFLAAWREAKGSIHFAIRTTRAALAKRCQNLDPKTAYRHILALIQHGFLRAKVHVKGGLQLLLNPALIVFDAAPAVVQAALAPTYPPVADLSTSGPAAGLETVLALAQKFTQNSRKRP